MPHGIAATANVAWPEDEPQPVAMAKVAPEGLPKFKKPIPMTPPLTDWDPAYVKRRAELPEQIFKLKNGKQFSYFTEGNKEDPAVVCFPPAAWGKYSYVMKEPLKGVFLIAVDDMGNGNSTPIDKPPVFSESVADIAELLDGLGVSKFYICGHSRGGVTAMQCAAGLGDRVLGCVVISSPCDYGHASVTSDKEVQKKLNTPNGGQGKGGFNTVMKDVMAVYNPKGGCFVGCMKMMHNGACYHKDKTKDFGFTGWEAGGYAYYIGKQTGGAPVSLKEDHFFVCACLDAELHGANCQYGMWFEMINILGVPWSYDVSKIQCPCHIYNETKGEVNIADAQHLNAIIPGSELTIWEQHGHCSIHMEFEKMVAGILEGKIVKEGIPGPCTVQK